MFDVILLLFVVGDLLWLLLLVLLLSLSLLLLSLSSLLLSISSSSSGNGVNVRKAAHKKLRKKNQAKRLEDFGDSDRYNIT